MEQDDMRVVMYKILAYLYSCMKEGTKPQLRHYAHDGDVLSIPYGYWADIIRELVKHNYVDGFALVPEWGGGVIVKANDPRITLEGVEFLQENSNMRKALNAIKEAKSALPFI